MFGFRFRSEKAKTATVIGLTFIALPLLVPAVFYLLMLPFGGGSAVGYMLAFLLATSGSWVIWLPIVIGIVFFLLAIDNESDARR